MAVFLVVENSKAFVRIHFLIDGVLYMGEKFRTRPSDPVQQWKAAKYLEDQQTGRAYPERFSEMAGHYR
jgi:hypothetical protein